jgi:RNA polymerase sigma factor (sigma-70 family)
VYWPSRRLSRKEERALLQAAQNGDEEARNELVVNNIPFVVTRAKRMAAQGSYLDFDDLVSVGVLALIHSVGKFDLRRENSFITFAKWHILDHMQKALRRARSQASDMDEALGLPAESRYDQDVVARDLQDAIASLPDESAFIIREVLAGRRRVDIGASLGVCRETARGRYRRAARLLRSRLR